MTIRSSISTDAIQAIVEPALKPRPPFMPAWRGIPIELSIIHIDVNLA
jgi:hypothetical protein